MTDRLEGLGGLLPAELVAFVREHSATFGWLAAVSGALFLISLVAIPFAIARIRPDYFVSRAPGPQSWWMRHRVVRYSVLGVKNVIGGLLVLAGLAMLVLPGQGIITVLCGITLLDFPGKRRLEGRIVRLRHVRSAIDWLRKRARRPPLILPDEDPPG